MALASYLRANPVPGKTVILTALKAPRSPDSLFPHWIPLVDQWCLVDLPGQPMVPTSELQDALSEQAVLWTGEGTRERIQQALEEASPDGRVLVAGSLYLIGAIRETILSLLGD